MQTPLGHTLEYVRTLVTIEASAPIVLHPTWGSKQEDPCRMDTMVPF